MFTEGSGRGFLLNMLIVTESTAEELRKTFSTVQSDTLDCDMFEFDGSDGEGLVKF